MRVMKHGYRILVGNTEGKDNVKNLGVDGKVLLKWFIKSL
jgi:hypothetical protein